jgi:hypothetical protein
MDTDTNNIPATDDTNPNGGTKEVVFDEKQQERVNELIKQAMGRAGKDARKEAESMRSELETLRSELAQLRTQPSTKKNEAAKDDLEARIREVTEPLKSELQSVRQEAQLKAKEADAARKEAQQIRKKVAMQSAAQKLPFHDMDDVIELTERHIDWDEDLNTYVVKGPDGHVRYNSGMKPMTPEEFYTELASKKPHLVRGSAKGGTNSTENSTALKSGARFALDEVFGPKSNADKAMKLKRENPNEYARLRGIAVEAGLLAK